MKFTKHVSIAAGLFVAVLIFIVARNWTTFALIVDNMAAMNEGKQVAQQIRYPSDLLTYLAEHPEHVSLVAYDVGAADEGIVYQAAQPRPMVSVPNLMLLAAYAHRTAAGQIDPGRRIPLAALEPYALPGAGEEQHRRARTHWREQGLLDADSTVALRHVVRAITRFGDRAATDWFITDLGRAAVDELPAHFGLDASASRRSPMRSSRNAIARRSVSPAWSASSRARSISSPSGATRFTSPQRCASSTSIQRPVNSSSVATW